MAVGDDAIRRTVRAGDVIFRAGDPGECAYIIERGAVDITAERDGERMVLARRGPGEIFGEMAIVDDMPRSAGAYAVADTVLLILSRKQLQHRVQPLDPVLRMVLQVILQRFRESLGAKADASSAPCSMRMFGDDACEDDCAGDQHRAAIDRVELEQSLRKSLSDGDLSLAYQPIVDARTRRLAGLEALARWTHPRLGAIGPGVFVAAAEEAGLTPELSRWAVDTACAAARKVVDLYAVEPCFSISVNITVGDVCDESFRGFVRERIAAHGIAARRLTLEITESSLMEDPDSARALLGEYRALGVPVSVDDFGTGYSSLSYIAHYPVDTLKIDRSFISRMRSDPRTQVVIRTMIDLARGLGLNTVAEGVERAEEAEMLAQFGCDRLQGYHFSRPVSLDEALATSPKRVEARTPQVEEATSA